MSNDKERLLQSIKAEDKRFTVIIGLSKNAGKSTFLNWLLEKTGADKAGVITTGRDGEEFDISIALNRGEKVVKPKIFIPEGTLFATVKDVIRTESTSLTIIEKLTSKAAGKDLWIVRADRDMDTEIFGPPSVREQLEIAAKMLSYGAQRIYIDGAYDRKAIAANVKSENIFLAVSPGAGNIRQIDELLANMKMLTTIKQSRSEEPIADRDRITFLPENDNPKQPVTSLPYKRLLGNEQEICELINNSRSVDAIFLPTGLTEKSYQLIKNSITGRKIRILVTHPLNISLTNRSLKKLLPLLGSIRKFSIDAIAVNSFAADGNHIDCDLLRSSVRKITSVPVVDVMEA